MAAAGVMEGIPEAFLANFRYRPGRRGWLVLRKVVNEEVVGNVWVGRSRGLGGIVRPGGGFVVIEVAVM